MRYSATEQRTPDNKVHVANMRPNWVLSAPGGPHGGPRNVAVRDAHSFAGVQHFLGGSCSLTNSYIYRHNWLWLCTSMVMSNISLYCLMHGHVNNEWLCQNTPKYGKMLNRQRWRGLVCLWIIISNSERFSPPKIDLMLISTYHNAVLWWSWYAVFVYSEWQLTFSRSDANHYGKPKAHKPCNYEYPEFNNGYP